MIVNPPFPAPYVGTCSQMPDELLAAMHARRRMTVRQEALAAAYLRRIKAQLKRARKAYEGRHDVTIQPELPLAH